METVIFALEIIGVTASAVSGAFTAIHKKMDAFGVTILGLVTATGGGVIRDLILGNTPPKIFRDPTYGIIAMLVSILTFIAVYLHKLHYGTKLYERIMLVMDTIGLAAYTVSGMGVAYSLPENYSLYLIIFVGVITGVGGGVLRDVLAGNRPYIFVKHIYALASIAGALLYAAMRGIAGDTAAMIAGMVLIVVIRALSAHFKWNLPHIDYENEEEKTGAKR